MHSCVGAKHNCQPASYTRSSTKAMDTTRHDGRSGEEHVLARSSRFVGGPPVDGIPAVHGRARQRDPLISQADVLSDLRKRRMRSADDMCVVQRRELLHCLCRAVDRQRIQAAGGSPALRGCMIAGNDVLMAASASGAAGSRS